MPAKSTLAFSVQAPSAPFRQAVRMSFHALGELQILRRLSRSSVLIPMYSRFSEGPGGSLRRQSGHLSHRDNIVYFEEVTGVILSAMQHRRIRESFSRDFAAALPGLPDPGRRPPSTRYRPGTCPKAGLHSPSKDAKAADYGITLDALRPEVADTQLVAHGLDPRLISARATPDHPMLWTYSPEMSYAHPPGKPARTRSIRPGTLRESNGPSRLTGHQSQMLENWHMK